LTRSARRVKMARESRPEREASRAAPSTKTVRPGRQEEVIPVSSVPGISERRDTSGRVHYQVRVRRSGNSQTATFAKLSEALAWRERALEAAEGGETLAPPQRRPAVSPPGRTVTVADASRRLCRGMVEGSVRTRDGRPYKPSVVRKYEEALRCVVLPRIGGVPIASLTSGDIQRLVDSIAAERTPEHARKALTALRVALRLAERYGELVANPCAGVRVPVDGQGEKPPRILTPEEATAIVAAGYAEDARRGGSFAGPLATLAFGSGARLGELLALPWGADGLDLEAAVLHVRRSVDRVRASDGLYPFLPPKTRDSRRDIPLAPDDVALLRRHRLATGRPPDGALVFATAQGDALSPIPAQRALKRAAKAAGLAEPLPRFHDARHAFASHALAAGLSAHAVAVLLGHSDAGLVWRRYGHALPDEVAQAGEALAAFRAARGA
jgi:integrase